MKLITFTDFDGNKISVRSDLIESIVHSNPHHINHNGGLRTTTGTLHSFYDPYEAKRVINELMEDTI